MGSEALTAAAVTLTLSDAPVPTEVDVYRLAAPAIALEQQQQPAPMIPLGQGRKVVTSTVIGAAAGCGVAALVTEDPEPADKGKKCFAGALVGGATGLVIGFMRR